MLFCCRSLKIGFCCSLEWEQDETCCKCILVLVICNRIPNILRVQVLNSAPNLKCYLRESLKTFRFRTSKVLGHLNHLRIWISEFGLRVLWSRANNQGLRLKNWRQKSVVHRCSSSLLLESWAAATYLSPGWYSSCRSVRDPCPLWQPFEVQLCSQFVLATIPLFCWDLSGNPAPRGESTVTSHSACNKTTHSCLGLLVEKRQVVNLCVLNQDLDLEIYFLCGNETWIKEEHGEKTLRGVLNLFGLKWRF